MTKITGTIFFKTMLNSSIRLNPEDRNWILDIKATNENETDIEVWCNSIQSTMSVCFYSKNLIEIESSNANYIIRLSNCQDRSKLSTKKERIICNLAELAPMQIAIQSFIKQIDDILEEDPDAILYSKDLEIITEARDKSLSNDYPIELLMELRDIFGRLSHQI